MSKILKNCVSKIEDNFVKNASQNPTIPCRTVLAYIENVLQTDSTAAATSMTKMSVLKQRIYRAREHERFSLWNEKLCLGCVAF